MRHLSIPRLELQAAVMAVRLKEQIVKEHESKIHNCNFWTDSTTVLQWIHSSHRKQQVFVANRVAEILNTTNVSQWNHRVVLTIQLTSEHERSMLTNLREVNGSLGRPG